MRAIGFRATPTDIYFAIVDGAVGDYTVLAQDAVHVPAALLPPNQLHFLRTVLLDVMEEYGVACAGLRTSEPIALRHSTFRGNVEGVVQELLASSAAAWYFAGQKARIASLLGVTQPVLTAWIDKDAGPPFATDWGGYGKEEREAILTACAALNGSPAEPPAEAILNGIGGKA